MTTQDRIEFFLPGPTWVRPDVLQALTGPMIGHRSAPFKALYASLAPRLQKVFRTQGDVLIASGSATHTLREWHGTRLDDPPPAYVSAFADWLDDAVARAAAQAGATVTLVAGPVSLATPPGVERIDVGAQIGHPPGPERPAALDLPGLHAHRVIRHG